MGGHEPRLYVVLQKENVIKETNSTWTWHHDQDIMILIVSYITEVSIDVLQPRLKFPKPDDPAELQFCFFNSSSQFLLGRVMFG